MDFFSKNVYRKEMCCMEWLNQPNESLSSRGACFIRICTDKTNCSNYACILLYCGSNN